MGVWVGGWVGGLIGKPFVGRSQKVMLVYKKMQVGKPRTPKGDAVGSTPHPKSRVVWQTEHPESKPYADKKCGLVTPKPRKNNGLSQALNEPKP